MSKRAEELKARSASGCTVQAKEGWFPVAVVGITCNGYVSAAASDAAGDALCAAQAYTEDYQGGSAGREEKGEELEGCKHGKKRVWDRRDSGKHDGDEQQEKVRPRPTDDAAVSML